MTNAQPPEAKPDSTAERLKSFVERIERMDEERKGMSDDIKDVFAECKGHGFDVKIIRQVLKLRKMEASDRQEQEALLETYLNALGMTPLEQAAAARAS
jgi:uncharacterized protein (UPF0335 family)